MQNSTVQHQFNALSQTYPDRTAVEQGTDILSYRELNARAREIADRIGGAGLSRKAVVAVMLDAGADYIATVLGILEAGHVFMPINMHFPARRIVQIIEKSRPELWILAAADKNKFLEIEQHATNLLIKEVPATQDTSRAESGGLSMYALCCPQSEHNPDGPGNETDKRTLDDACYVMTTSGSTGEPKMILGSHRGLSHFIHWETKAFDLGPEVRCSFLSHTSFDVSLRDVFVPLLCGGTICIPGETVRNSPDKLFDWLQNDRITQVHIVPTVLRTMLSTLDLTPGKAGRLQSLELALIAGEPLYASDILSWRSRVNSTTRLINIYGPSETTLAKLYFEVDGTFESANEMIPIGQPIPDTRVFILNDKNRPCRTGEIGEIYIDTCYRSLGYLNDPEEERTRFVRNPLTGKAHDIVYKTGDIGLFTVAGFVECIGRKDNQVKLHGNRVELNEIEAVLRTHPGVSQCAVAVKHDSGGNQRLVGYVVTNLPQPPSTESLRRCLAECLPDYMIPSVFVVLDTLPLTHNNKVDRKMLPEPTRERPLLEHEYVPPSSRGEISLHRLWMRLLDLNRVGINDNFFDVGGTSILAMRLLVMLKQELNVDIVVTKLYEYPTVRKLAAFIDNGGGPGTVDDSVIDRARKRTLAVQRRRTGRFSG